ncbi:hypothetical protein NADFUDRAFT_43249 [Nadsonia fulvescens var. elongata DSM 6958]|uniref:Uncharacterized protein n=1 Tax=Nadsonia fulvescens var. elongata DSM 6958 TaxID=857566 RepID=A0A1E3PH32_9ASCO|nr:hypothetical protein NADFUDRAFT_43249 [Nadsonia fulvescens var. elongata DSM 6958]
MAEKPREELSYQDFYPDLDSRANLTIFTKQDQINEAEVAQRKGDSDEIINSEKPDSILLETILNSELRKIHRDGTEFKIQKHAIKQPHYYDIASYDKKNVDGGRFRLSVASIDPGLFEYGYHKVKDDFQLPKAYLRTVSLGERTSATLTSLITPGFSSSENNWVNYNPLTAIINPAGSAVSASSGISFIDNDDLVEYDMDEQDEHILNSQLKISKEEFEIVMSMIDKQWFEIERAMLPKSSKGRRWKQIGNDDKGNSQEGTKFQDSTETNDDGDKWLLDQRCAVCDDGECDNNNAIVFCDGCDLAVHQDCYGVAFIPEGQWLCRKCMIARRKLRVSCIFCPNDSTVSTAVPGVGPMGEAFKQTDSSQWAHLICALWIPEVEIANPVCMEPIVNMANIPKDRWKLSCYICRKRGEGACIQCNNKNCFQAFHPTCARRAGLYMNMTEGIQGAVNNPSSMIVYCDKHTTSDYASAHNVPQTVKDAQQFYKTEFVSQRTDKPRGGKDHRVGQRWKTTLGAPVLPRMVYDKVVELLRSMRAKAESKIFSTTVELVAQLICKYWVLKRELKRGAWLIKRLQTKLDLSLNYSGIKEFQFGTKLSENQQYLKELTSLRQYVRKLKQQQQVRMDMALHYGKVLQIGYFPESTQFGRVIDLIEHLDTSHFFQKVPQDEMYLSVIKSPMSIEIMRHKVSLNQYLSLEAGLDDVKQMINNARYYNEDMAPVVIKAHEIELAIAHFLRPSGDLTAQKQTDALTTGFNQWKTPARLSIPRLANGLPNWSPYATDGLDITEWIGRRIMREMSSPLTSDLEMDENYDQNGSNEIIDRVNLKSDELQPPCTLIFDSEHSKVTKDAKKRKRPRHKRRR